MKKTFISEWKNFYIGMKNVFNSRSCWEQQTAAKVFLPNFISFLKIQFSATWSYWMTVFWTPPLPLTTPPTIRNVSPKGTDAPLCISVVTGRLGTEIHFSSRRSNGLCCFRIESPCHNNNFVSIAISDPSCEGTTLALAVGQFCPQIQFLDWTSKLG